MILGYTLTTFPKSLIQTKTTKRTSTELRAVKEEGPCILELRAVKEEGPCSKNNNASK